jgi:uncharacterized protein (TIGR04255 family)
VTPIRPKFTNPPLIERAIKVVFDRLPNFSLGDYGLFWSEILTEFPVSECMDSVTTEIEQFEEIQLAQIGIQILPSGSLPRAAFRNASAGELIQVQPDCFGFNWIKTGDDHKYPHSEATLDRFFSLFEFFSRYIARRNLGNISILQCELTNVNIIPVSDVGQSFADVATVLRLAPSSFDYPQLQLENQLVGSRHLMLDDMGNNIGRVHAVSQPSLGVPGNEKVYRLDIIARGAPLGPGVQGARNFFEQAVSAVNGVFLASVTETGRQFWGEYDDSLSN